MGFAEIFGFLYAGIKAIPIIDSWFKKFYEFYVDKDITRIEGKVIKYREKRTILYYKIGEAKSHEEKRVLFSILNDVDYVDNNKLSDVKI